MMTSELMRERIYRAYLLARAERMAVRIYGKSLDRLPLADWREVWKLVDECERGAQR
jgi:hypothetical protein